MIKNFLLLIAILAVFIVRLKAQDAKLTQFDIIAYGELINQAEINIVYKNYSKAVEFYDKANNGALCLFGKDLLNASLCYSLLNDTVKTRQYLQLLAKMGYNPDSLKNYYSLQIALSQNTKDTLKNIFLKAVDRTKSIRSSLNALFERDQSLRQGVDPYKKRSGKIRQIDSLNVKELNKIIQKNRGFPNEWNSGINMSNLFWLPYYIVILHQSATTKIYDYSDQILTQIKNGNIEPHVGAHLYTTCSGNGKLFGQLEIAKYVFTGEIPDSILMFDANVADSLRGSAPWGLPILPTEMLAAVNSNRKAFGLETAEDYAIKAVFALQDSIGFKFYNIISNTYFTKDKKLIEFFEQNYQPIQTLSPFR